MEAMSKSRTKPVTREARVNNETTEADLRSDTAASVCARQQAMVTEGGGLAYNGWLC
jgi:hypothetical protein